MSSPVQKAANGGMSWVFMAATQRLEAVAHGLLLIRLQFVLHDEHLAHAVLLHRLVEDVRHRAEVLAEHPGPMPV